MSRELISHSEAKARGLKTFYDGKPCKKANHDSERYTANRGCVACTKISNDLKLVLVRNQNRPKLSLLAEPKKPKKEPTTKETQSFAGWTPENQAKLIAVYIDTGDIATAREAIGVSASIYHECLKQDDNFSAAVAEATPLARQHLKERALQLGLRGNDKLLIAALKAEFPEFRDSLKVDMQTTVRNISDVELNRRLERLTRRQVIDAQFTAIESRPEIKAIASSGREGTESSAEQNSYALSGIGAIPQGTVQEAS